MEKKKEFWWPWRREKIEVVEERELRKLKNMECDGV